MPPHPVMRSAPGTVSVCTRHTEPEPPGRAKAASTSPMRSARWR
jgi:hypothetical protein